MQGGTVTQSKLWQVGKVYRRDNPVMSKGRMREFSQAVRACSCYSTGKGRDSCCQTRVMVFATTSTTVRDG